MAKKIEIKIIKQKNPNKRIKTTMLIPKKTFDMKEKHAENAIRWNVKDAEEYIEEHREELFTEMDKTYVINFLFDRGYKSGKAFKYINEDSIQFYNPDDIYEDSNEAKNYNNDDIYGATITQY